jgi:hypothetical protein
MDELKDKEKIDLKNPITLQIEKLDEKRRIRIMTVWLNSYDLHAHRSINDDIDVWM